MRIREQEGLAYSAHAQTVAGSGEDPGRLVAYSLGRIGTEPVTEGSIPVPDYGIDLPDLGALAKFVGARRR